MSGLLVFFLAFVLNLWRRSEVDDALQLHPVSKLLHQEGVPVLVDGPLCGADAAQLKHVQGKDVPERTQHASGFQLLRGLDECGPQHLPTRRSPTCRCRRSARKPGQEIPLRPAGERGPAAAASSFGSCRRRSEKCTTSAEGPGTSSAAGY